MGGVENFAHHVERDQGKRRLGVQHAAGGLGIAVEMEFADRPRVARLIEGAADRNDAFDLQRQIWMQIERSRQHGQRAHADHGQFIRILADQFGEQLFARRQMVQRGTRKIGMSKPQRAVQLLAVDAVIDVRGRPQPRPARRIELIEHDAQVLGGLRSRHVSRRRQHADDFEFRVINRQCNGKIAVNPWIADEDDFLWHDGGPPLPLVV